MSYIFDPATDFAIALITLLDFARHDGPTCNTISPAFTNGFLIRGTLSVVRETRLAPEMHITLCTGYSHASVNTCEDCHAIATRLLTAVGGSTRAGYVTCIN